MSVQMVWNEKHKGKRGWLVIGRIGGEGTFWEGFEYSIGVFPWYWLAFVRGLLHVTNKPLRAVRFEHVHEQVIHRRSVARYRLLG